MSLRAPLIGLLLGGAVALVFLHRPARRPLPPPEARELDEILALRNDNDPRLDRDFLGLSADVKRLFREKYRALPPERRNERGTIVYLLGKNLQTREDWSFFTAVVSEPPCLGLADCSQSSGESAGPGDDVTLAYPSLVALRQAARAAAEGGSREGARAVLDAARASRSPAVARLVKTIDSRARP